MSSGAAALARPGANVTTARTAAPATIDLPSRIGPPHAPPSCTPPPATTIRRRPDSPAGEVPGSARPEHSSLQERRILCFTRGILWHRGDPPGPRGRGVPMRLLGQAPRPLATQGALVPDLARIAALALVYFLAGKFGLLLAFANQSASPVWPPTGIALAAVVLLGPRVWPGVLI